MQTWFSTLVTLSLLAMVANVADSCRSRATPKPDLSRIGDLLDQIQELLQNMNKSSGSKPLMDDGSKGNPSVNSTSGGAKIELKSPNDKNGKNNGTDILEYARNELHRLTKRCAMSQNSSSSSPRSRITKSIASLLKSLSGKEDTASNNKNTSSSGGSNSKQNSSGSQNGAKNNSNSSTKNSEQNSNGKDSGSGGMLKKMVSNFLEKLKDAKNSQ